MIFSSVRCRVECRNGARLVTRLSAKGIKISNVCISDTEVSFTVSSRHYREAVSLADKFGYTLQTDGYSGLAGVLQRSIPVLPYIITVLTVSLVCLVATFYVYNVKVVDTDGNPCYEVETFLREQGIGGTVLKSDIDIRGIERMILDGIDNISFVTCSIQGLSLYVTVVEKDNPQEIESADSLTATIDGVVTRVIVRSGTPLVKEGERVSVGDELIAGYHIADNTPTDGEENGEKIECVADGEVYGIVYHHKRVVIPDSPVYMQATGNIVQKRDIYLGSWLIGRVHTTPFEYYQYTRTETVINNLLPFTVVTHIYHEYQEVAMDRVSYIDRVLADTRRDIIENMPIGGKMTAFDHSIKTVGESEVIDIFVQVEQRLDNGGQNY